MSIESTTTSFCTFALADLHLGVPVTDVQEVIHGQVRTRVPLVSTVINGLINLRGEIVTTIDLRARMGMPPAPVGTESMNVVIRRDDEAVSILVDEIKDVLDVEWHRFEAVPAMLRGACRDLMTGIFKLEGSLLLVLDIDKLLDLAGEPDHTGPTSDDPTPDRRQS